MGLADVLVPQQEVREAAIKLAGEIGENSPLGLIATRMTLRGEIADRVRKATDHELEVQTRLRRTEDFKEGVKAVFERRLPNFKGQRVQSKAIWPTGTQRLKAFVSHSSLRTTPLGAAIRIRIKSGKSQAIVNEAQTSHSTNRNQSRGVASHGWGHQPFG